MSVELKCISPVDGTVFAVRGALSLAAARQAVAKAHAAQAEWAARLLAERIDLVQAAAGSFTWLGLELGGKDPGYVMNDVDVEAAADTLIDGT